MGWYSIWKTKSSFDNIKEAEHDTKFKRIDQKEFITKNGKMLIINKNDFKNCENICIILGDFIDKYK